MRISAVFSVALRNLQRASARSSLTALGIIVGIAAVVMTASIGSGAKAKIQDTLTRPESRTIYLAAAVPRGQARRGTKLARADGLNPEDYYAIRDAVANGTAVSPRIYVSPARAQANGRTADITLEGIDVDGFASLSAKVLDGVRFNSLDVRRAANVCLISESLAHTLFPDGQAWSRPIRLNDKAFAIIGIVEDIQTGALNPLATADLHVYVPFTSLLRRLDTTAQIFLSAQAIDIAHVSIVQQQLSDIMEQRRSGRRAEFRINNSVDAIKMYTDSSLAMTRLLAAVGTISLIVGGIGIMNIMLVSVSERTREIGVRMAIGTRCRDILGQFLAEAIALSLLGGALGTAIGWSASVVLTHLNGWPTAMTLDSVLTALFCSVGVGLFFGYHPARRAALMQPVDALRSEH